MTWTVYLAAGTATFGSRVEALAFARANPGSSMEADG